MRIEALTQYRCLACGSTSFSVDSTKDLNAEIITAELRCDGCHASYRVQHGIPRFVQGTTYTGSFGFQWLLHRKTQLDSYTGRPISCNRFFQATRWPRDLKGQLVLEAGCGAGRFTEVLLDTGAEVFSFDCSAAVESNWHNNGSSARLHLFQADIYDIPLQSSVFDKVVCLGVLQHTPDPERAFRVMSGFVRPGGELVVDVYKKSLASVLQWKYLLRPLARLISERTLYRIVAGVVPCLLPSAKFLRRIAGRVGARLLPIAEYSYLGLPPDLNRQWATLDTFDMYSPVYDRPQSFSTVERWYAEAGFVDIAIQSGPNGCVGRGRRPK
jgi:2-polyprenyl-3-methyl-5-hydroxy-6-metoxy-1,4-benzoquinol methylase